MLILILLYFTFVKWINKKIFVKFVHVVSWHHLTKSSITCAGIRTWGRARRKWCRPCRCGCQSQYCWPSSPHPCSYSEFPLLNHRTWSLYSALKNNEQTEMCQSKSCFTGSGFSTSSVLSQWHELLRTVTLSIAIVGHQFDFIHSAGVYGEKMKSVSIAHAANQSKIHMHSCLGLTHIHWAGFVDFAVTVELLMGIEVWCKKTFVRDVWSCFHHLNFPETHTFSRNSTRIYS